MKADVNYWKNKCAKLDADLQSKDTALKKSNKQLQVIHIEINYFPAMDLWYLHHYISAVIMIAFFLKPCCIGKNR